MELSFFLGKFFGLYLIIVGIALLSRRQVMHDAIESFFKNPGLTIFAGVVLISGGLLVVLSHNIWEMSWRVIITIIGYIYLARGISRVYFPAWGHDIALKIADTNWHFYIGVVVVLVGIYLTCKGFAW